MTKKKKLLFVALITLFGGAISTFIQWGIYKYCFHEDVNGSRLIISFVCFVIPMFFVFYWISTGGKSGNKK